MGTYVDPGVRTRWKSGAVCECRHIPHPARRGIMVRSERTERTQTLEEPTHTASGATEITAIPCRRMASQRDEGELRAMRLAMRTSLAFGVLMLVGKMATASDVRM